MPDKKKGALIIDIGVGKAKPSFADVMKGEKAEVEPDEDDAGDASEMQVSAMKAFMKASSPEAKAIALSTFVKACKEGY